MTFNVLRKLATTSYFSSALLTRTLAFRKQCMSSLHVYYTSFNFTKCVSHIDNRGDSTVWSPVMKITCFQNVQLYLSLVAGRKTFFFNIQNFWQQIVQWPAIISASRSCVIVDCRTFFIVMAYIGEIPCADLFLL